MKEIRKNSLFLASTVLLFCSCNAQLYSEVASGGRKVYTFYLGDGEPMILTPSSLPRPPGITSRSSEGIEKPSESANTNNMFDADALAKLFMDPEPSSVNQNTEGLGNDNGFLLPQPQAALKTVEFLLPNPSQVAERRNGDNEVKQEEQGQSQQHVTIQSSDGNVGQSLGSVIAPFQQQQQQDGFSISQLIDMHTLGGNGQVVGASERQASVNPMNEGQTFTGQPSFTRMPEQLPQTPHRFSHPRFGPPRPQPAAVTGLMNHFFPKYSQHHLQQRQPTILSPAGAGSLRSFYGRENIIPHSHSSDSESQGSAPDPEILRDPSTKVLQLTDGISGALNSVTQSLQSQYKNPLASFTSILGLGSDDYPKTVVSPGDSFEAGSGWGPETQVIHHPPTYISHDDEYTDDPFGSYGHHHHHSHYSPPPRRPKIPNVMKYVKTAVTSWPFSPYHKKDKGLQFFKTVGSTLDTTLGGAWAARRAIKKGAGAVISSKVRLGGTLAYVGSEVLAKAIDVAAAI